MNGQPTPDGLPRILLFHGRGAVSWMIRTQTRSYFSHAAILLPDGRHIIEAWQGTNRVQHKAITSWDGVYQFSVPTMTADGWQRTMEFLEKAISQGWRYDYRGVARFLTRRMYEFQHGRAFCSSLVHEAILQGGVRLLRCNSGLVSPAMLDLSPLVNFELPLKP